MYFSTKWCQPCKALKPIVQEVSRESNIQVDFIDAEDHSDLAQQFKITSVPTIIVIKDNRPVVRHTGMATKQQISSLFSQN